MAERPAELREVSADHSVTRPWWHALVGPVLGSSLHAAVRSLYRIEMFGTHNLKRSLGALVVSNHRRDTDGPLIGGILLQRHGMRFRGVRPFFVAREDLFRRGFLRHYLKHWPRMLHRPLGTLTCRAALHSVQMFPMRRISERSMIELLEDVYAVLGDVTLDQVLKPRRAWQLAQSVGRRPEELSLGEALTVRHAMMFEYHAFRKLVLPTLHAIKPFERQAIERQLAVFVDLIERGETVLLQPEGTISHNGSFRRPRRALFELLNRPARTPHVLPAALSYDCMTPRRARVLVSFGKAQEGLRNLSRRETNQRVSEAVLNQCMITASQLVAHRLYMAAADGNRQLSIAELGRYLAAVAERCRAAQVAIDPCLLDARTREKRLQECVHFCVSQQFVRRDSADRLGFDDSLYQSVPSRFAKQGMVAYLNNELTSITALHPRLLPDASQ